MNKTQLIDFFRDLFDSLGIIHTAVICPENTATNRGRLQTFTYYRYTEGRMLAHLAAYAGNITVTEELIKLGINTLEDRDFNNGNLLHWAASGGSFETMEKLIHSGIAYNSVNNVGSDALIYALRNGHTELVYNMIRMGWDPKITLNYGFTLLHAAAYCNNIELLTALISNYGLNPYAQDHQGHNLLCWAQKSQSTTKQAMIDFCTNTTYLNQLYATYLQSFKCHRIYNKAIVSSTNIISNIADIVASYAIDPITPATRFKFYEPLIKSNLELNAKFLKPLIMYCDANFLKDNAARSLLNALRAGKHYSGPQK